MSSETNSLGKKRQASFLSFPLAIVTGSNENMVLGTVIGIRATLLLRIILSDPPPSTIQGLQASEPGTTIFVKFAPEVIARESAA